MVNFFIRNGINRRIVPSLDSTQSVNNKPLPSQLVFTVHANNTQPTIAENVFIRANNTKPTIPVESVDDKIYFNSHIKQCEEESEVKSDHEEESEENEEESEVRSDHEEESEVKSENEEESEVKSDHAEESEVKSEDEEESEVKSEQGADSDDESQ